MCSIRSRGIIRSLPAAGLLLTVFSPLECSAGDSFPYEARIIAPGAPVQSGPGESFYPTDTLAQGDAVQVYKEQPDGWLGIRPPQDSFSWVFGKHLKLLEDGLAEVDKADVPSRIGSRLSDKRDAAQVKLKKGERVEILGEQIADGQTWYKIAPPSGEFRWIHMRNVTRTDLPPAAETDLPPVVIVPMDSDNLPRNDPAVTLAVDSQPSADTTWRASPADAAAPAGNDADASAVTAPPLANPGASEASASTSPANSQAATPATPVTSDSPDSTSPETTSIAGSPAGAANGPATPQKSSGPVGDGLARRLTEVEMRLSRIVAEPPATWQTEPLQRELEQLLGHAQTASERNAVQNTLAKVDRFAAIGRRYRSVVASSVVATSPDLATPTTDGLPYDARSGNQRITGSAGSGDPRTTGSGQLPITPVGSAPTGILAADGQRYDAVGILRPVVSKRPGAPQFALLNERGQVVSFVTPTPDVNLQPFVGHRVGITGSQGYIPEFQRAHVTAGRVAPLDQRMLR